MRHSGNYHGFFVPLFDDADVGADGDADATVETGADPGAEPAAQCKQGDSEIESSTANGRPRLRLLILGGYGSFGGRLAQLLCAEQGVSLIIAGRSHAKATAFCADLPPGAQRQAIALDRECDLTQQLSALKPDILIDATGPFQEYGDDPYRVVKAAIAAGIHYLDLADGSAFVRGMGQFDDAAKEQGVAVLSGVSSFPVLTAAVVRLLARDLRRVESITAGIAPSPYAGY
ncbi:MAG TPA: saccharopine dehydrogenase NADP-binding domain-containing protein, partial [Gammaproteobacteria bacterium]|nr:saccharopine dehydrogenase NADP-binding domain-containing protein [Gammaproteobacteria bacterium]